MSDDEEVVEDMDSGDDHKPKLAPVGRSPRRARSTDMGGSERVRSTRRSPTRTKSNDGSNTSPIRPKSVDGSSGMTRRAHALAASCTVGGDRNAASMTGMGGSERVRPTRQSPNRTKSNDGSSGMMRRGHALAASCTVGGDKKAAPLRRMRTDGTERVGRMTERQEEEEDEDDDDDNNNNSNTPAPRKTPARSKTSDGLGRMLPMRTKSGTGMSIGPTRSAPRRTASGFGRTTPRRTKSSDLTASTLGGLRKGRKKEKAGQQEDHLNIFGSDIVSSGAIIEDIEKAKENQNICRLELEDFFIAERDDPEEIALALKDLLESDHRPWESVHFTDDIMDGAIYAEFKDRKKRFIKTLGGVFESRLIPVSYKAKITLSSGSLNIDEMVELLFYLQSDKSVIDLTLKSEQVDQRIIRALAQLFKVDKRKWASVSLQLSGTGPGKPGSKEHTAWAKEMQAATEEMQKVCLDRGIKLG